jgi:hypothetical protein
MDWRRSGACCNLYLGFLVYMYGSSTCLRARERMSTWLTITLAIAVLIIVPTVRAVILRAMRKRQPKQVEKPNSYYTPKLVLDRDSRNRWRSIHLPSVHEINRGEVSRLVDKVDALGVDSLTSRERIFLDRMAELYAPAQPPHISIPRPADDAFWADPFGFERRLGNR